MPRLTRAEALILDDVLNLVLNDTDWQEMASASDEEWDALASAAGKVKDAAEKWRQR